MQRVYRFVPWGLSFSPETSLTDGVWLLPESQRRSYSPERFCYAAGFAFHPPAGFTSSLALQLHEALSQAALFFVAVQLAPSPPARALP